MAAKHISQKRASMHVCPKSNIFPEESYLKLGNVTLPAVGRVKDLGVLIDDQLKFHLPINRVVAFTKTNLIIMKCFTSRNAKYCRCAPV